MVGKKEGGRLSVNCNNDLQGKPKSALFCSFDKIFPLFCKEMIEEIV